MHPVLRLWGITALCVALLLLVRGAFALAIACFLLSPAPALLFVHGGVDQRRLSLSWLGWVAAVMLGCAILFTAVIYLGGIPQLHEWPSALRGSAR